MSSAMCSGEEQAKCFVKMTHLEHHHLRRQRWSRIIVHGGLCLTGTFVHWVLIGLAWTRWRVTSWVALGVCQSTRASLVAGVPRFGLSLTV